MAPCFIIKLDEEEDYDPAYINDQFFKLQSLGVYAFHGPNWTRDLQTICDNWDRAYCMRLTYLGGQGVGVESEIYWTMNAITNRFQEKVADQEWGIDMALDETPLVNLGDIK